MGRILIQNGRIVDPANRMTPRAISSLPMTELSGLVERLKSRMAQPLTLLAQKG